MKLPKIAQTICKYWVKPGQKGYKKKVNTTRRASESTTSIGHLSLLYMGVQQKQIAARFEMFSTSHFDTHLLHDFPFLILLYDLFRRGTIEARLTLKLNTNSYKMWLNKCVRFYWTTTLVI